MRGLEHLPHLELSFADDAAIVTCTREDLVKATVELNSVLFLVTVCYL